MIKNSSDQKKSLTKDIHFAFLIMVITKGMGAVIEIISSVFILFISPAFVQHAVYILTRGELSDNPNDVVANFLVRTAADFAVSGQYFAFLYLLSHGVIKLFIIIQLLRRKLWAYPLAIIVFFIFIVYQQYRYTHTHSPWLLFLTVLDVIVIVLTWWEYSKVKKHQEVATAFEDIFTGK